MEAFPLQWPEGWLRTSPYKRGWAKAFCKTAAKLGYEHHEGHPIDEEWMTTWFANALMRGWDEHASRSPSEDVR